LKEGETGASYADIAVENYVDRFGPGALPNFKLLLKIKAQNYKKKQEHKPIHWYHSPADLSGW
jgi:hypothetical protein